LGVAYDEKPGIQRLARKAPDLPPEPLRYPNIAGDHECVRMGTLSLLAGIDLVTGVVHASVEKRHRSREFIEILKRPDAAYAPATAIKIILDNHSALEGRFTFVFTSKHGSWLNLVEASSRNSHARPFATSVSSPWMNCANVSSPQSTWAIANPSSTLGPTRSTTRRDISRFLEALV
jgi:hypothetical protein